MNFSDPMQWKRAALLDAIYDAQRELDDFDESYPEVLQEANEWHSKQLNDLNALAISPVVSDPIISGDEMSFDELEALSAQEPTR